MASSKAMNLRYELLSPVEKAEQDEKSWRSLKWAWLSFICQGWLVYLFLSRPIDYFPARSIDDWYPITMLWFVGIGSSAQLITYSKIWERHRGKPFSKRTRTIVVAIGIT